MQYGRVKQDSKTDNEEFNVRGNPMHSIALWKFHNMLWNLSGEAFPQILVLVLQVLLLDLQVMNLLTPGIKVTNIIIEKSKIDREKSWLKVKSNEMQGEDLEKLILYWS